MKRTHSLVLCLFGLAIVLAACGKEGPPVPLDRKNMMEWGEINTGFTGESLLIVAALNGNDNADSYTLELEPFTDGICLDCPFKPSEFPPVSPTYTDEGLLTFQYMPTNRAPAYRFRLIAKNIYMGLPHTLSPVQTVEKTF